MQPTDEAARARRIAAALQQYIEACTADTVPDREAFCARHGDLAEALRSRIGDYLLLRSGLAAPPTAGPGAARSLDFDPERLLGRRIGSFQLARVLGVGGMGVVYGAEQAAPRRAVALKLIRPGRLSQDTWKRFRREIEILGRLSHPGIARIFDAGTADLGEGEQPWYAMEAIEGRTLCEYAVRVRPPLRQKLELLAEIAGAVHHAHELGIVHRDLKPGNILVDGAGRPHVVDFGVARTSGPGELSTRIATASGAVIGTLHSMSPEQLSGHSDRATAASDVYALGAIGYELVSGRLPHGDAAVSLARLARTIEEDDPTPLRTLDRGVPRDVDTILATALEKEPGRRYASAAEFAADLRRHRAMIELTAHNHADAIARFDAILRIDPGREATQKRRAEAAAALGVK